MIDFEEIAFMHDAPRFGHTKQISYLASQDPERSNNYIGGIVAFSIFLLSFLIAWALIIVVFKIRGIYLHGWMAGRVMYQKHVEGKRFAYQRHRKIQLLFTFASLGFFTGAAVLLRLGLPTLERAVMAIRELNDDLRNTLEEGQGIASFTTNAIQPLKNSTIEQFSDKVNLYQFCDNQTAIDDFNIEETVDSMAKSLYNMTSFLEKYRIEGLEENIDIMLERSVLLDDALQTYTDYDWTAKMYILAFGILCFFLLANIIAYWFGVSKEAFTNLTSYFTLPMFTMMIPGGWLITIAFATGATMNSDFCIGTTYGFGPEATIQDAILEYGIRNDDLMYQSFLYYKSDCTIQNPWEDEVVVRVSQMRKSISAVTELMRSRDQIEASCGNSVTPLIREIDDLKRDFEYLLSGMVRATNMARCQRVLPLYRRVFNGATCSESLEGLSLVFYSLFAIFLFAIMMVTLRSALYKIKVQLPNQTEAVKGEALEEKYDEDDMERFYLEQADRDSGNILRSMTIKEKPSEDTHISESASTDEENGFREKDNVFEGRDGEVLSSQSSIDTNEDFNDDGVNSFNAELEPLTPSPKMKGNPRRKENILSPTSFLTKENEENLLPIGPSADESEFSFPVTPQKTSKALRRMKASKKDGRKNYLNLG